jgi:uncharacterized membrane protein
MKKLKVNRTTGVALAIAAAAMLDGCASYGTGQSAVATTQTDLAHCYGVNVCGGHNDCKTASNACAGQGSCKGTGFVSIPTKACGDVGGTVKDDWRGEVATADLVQCFGVNTCKGHNDCKTATNACAGHSSCKGAGFVKTPSKACDDIGGGSNDS